MAVVTVCLLAALTGCGGDDGGSLVGTWVSRAEGETIEFTADGTLRIVEGADEGMEFGYEVDGDVLRLSLEGFEGSQDMACSLHGDTLTLSYDGDSVEYARAK